MEFRMYGKEIRSFIFDVDGVVSDLMCYFPTNIILAARDIGLPEEGIQEVQRYFFDVWSGQRTPKNSFRENIKDIFPSINEKQMNLFLACMDTHEKEHPYPIIKGSKEALHGFKRCGAISLCTSNFRALLEQKFSTLGISLNIFDCISTPDKDSAGVAKPDPMALWHVFETTKIPPKETVFFGDWHPDVWAARHFPNMEFIGVTSGGVMKETFTALEVKEDHIFPSIFEAWKNFDRQQWRNIHCP